MTDWISARIICTSYVYTYLPTVPTNFLVNKAGGGIGYTRSGVGLLTIFLLFAVNIEVVPLPQRVVTFTMVENSSIGKIAAKRKSVYVCPSDGGIEIK